MKNNQKERKPSKRKNKINKKKTLSKYAIGILLMDILTSIRIPMTIPPHFPSLSYNFDYGTHEHMV